MIAEGSSKLSSVPSGGAAVSAGGAGGAAAGGAAAAEEKAEEKKEEEKVRVTLHNSILDANCVCVFQEESDDDMGFGLFD